MFPKHLNIQNFIFLYRMELIAIISLIVFALILIYLSWRFGDVSSENAYSMANGKAKHIFIAFGAFTVIGASTFVGVVQFTYLAGAYVLALGLGAGLGAWLLSNKGEKIYALAKKEEYHSLPDAIAERYGMYAGTLSTIISVVTLGALLIIQIAVGGLIISFLTGISAELGALILTLVVGIYVFTGGLKAVFVTDLLQGVGMFLLFIGSLIAMYILGGATPTELVVNTTPVELSFGLISLIIIFFFTGFLSITGGADIWLRYFSGKSFEESRKGLRFAGIMFIAFILLLVFFGLHVVMQLPDAVPGEAFVRYITEVLPQWIIPLAVIGIFAGALSTADAETHVISSMLSKERSRWKNRTLPSLNFQRYSVIVILLLAYLITIFSGFNPGDMFTAFLNIIMATGAAAWMLIFNKGNKNGMAVGLTLSLIIFIILTTSGLLFQGLWGLLIPLSVVIPCLVTKKQK